MTSVTNFRSLSRIEPADILENWIDYASWHSRMLRVVWVMDGEVLLVDCEDRAMVILTGPLSQSILKQGRAHTNFAKF